MFRQRNFPMLLEQIIVQYKESDVQLANLFRDKIYEFAEKINESLDGVLSKNEAELGEIKKELILLNEICENNHKAILEFNIREREPGQKDLDFKNINQKNIQTHIKRITKNEAELENLKQLIENKIFATDNIADRFKDLIIILQEHIGTSKERVLRIEKIFSEENFIINKFNDSFVKIMKNKEREISDSILECNNIVDCVLKIDERLQKVEKESKNHGRNTEVLDKNIRHLLRLINLLDICRTVHRQQLNKINHDKESLDGVIKKLTEDLAEIKSFCRCLIEYIQTKDVKEYLEFIKKNPEVENLQKKLSS